MASAQTLINASKLISAQTLIGAQTLINMQHLYFCIMIQDFASQWRIETVKEH